MPGQKPLIGCALMRRPARLAVVLAATLLPAAPVAAELRAGLLHVLAGSVRDRAVGTALLRVGIGLATAGSVLGASG